MKGKNKKLSLSFNQIIHKLSSEERVCHVYSDLAKQTIGAKIENLAVCNGNPAINGFLVDKSEEEEKRFPLCSFHLGILNELFAKNRNFQATNKLSLIFGHE